MNSADTIQRLIEAPRILRLERIVASVAQGGPRSALTRALRDPYGRAVLGICGVDPDEPDWALGLH